LLGFEASCEAEPASGLDDEVEDGTDEDEAWTLPPAGPEPFRPLRLAVCRPLSSTTDEKGAPAL
jgi:hypothetical protein